MTWIYKNAHGRYLHSFHVHRGVVTDTCWSSEQHDAYRFDDRNRASWVVFRCGESGSLRRLLPSGIIKVQIDLDHRMRVLERRTVLDLASQRMTSTEPSRTGEEKK